MFQDYTGNLKRAKEVEKVWVIIHESPFSTRYLSFNLGWEEKELQKELKQQIAGKKPEAET